MEYTGKPISIPKSKKFEILKDALALMLNVSPLDSSTVFKEPFMVKTDFSSLIIGNNEI
jgi:hypothetical protein